MLDFTVQILKDNVLHDVNLKDHIKDKKVLICPNIQLVQKTTIRYFKYVESLLDTYKLDEIILIDSTNNKFLPMFVNSYFPRFTAIQDNNKNLIQKLKQNKQINLPTKILSAKWIFQLLLDDCKEIGFWQQPLENQWNNLIQNKKAMQRLMKKRSFFKKTLQELYKTNNTQVFDLKNINLFFVGGNKGFEIAESGPTFFYFNLYLNNSLENALRSKNLQ